jgi:hypothetical protein
MGFGAVPVIMENLASPLGFDPQTIPPVANSYTKFAIMAPLQYWKYSITILHAIYFSTYSTFPYEDRSVFSPLFIQPVSSALHRHCCYHIT